MQLHRFHPLAGITAIIFVTCTLANFLTLDWRSAPISNAIGSALLASPFAVLFIAHITMAKTWRRNAYLATGSILFIAPWNVISFAMRWFHGGWPGLAVACVVLITLAMGFSLTARLIREK
ncbi:hypothetical protein [Duganella sp. Root336D2]|uniref:hypothetical protein n=1 Tax=Duganella sp. Root336D2 TaxID=1736518 RepID=UPI0006F8F889|nr:hypothetical protein [Duganella sp. Root336D2]KQV45982.1 hypothetical protein ASD07_15950 [Duganella sp. Root336D2]